MSQSSFVAQPAINLKSPNKLSVSLVPTGDVKSVSASGVVTVGGFLTQVTATTTTIDGYLTPYTTSVIDKGQLKKVSLIAAGSGGKLILKANSDSGPTVNTIMRGTTVVPLINLSTVGDSVLLKYEGNGVWYIVDKGACTYTV